MIFMIVYYNCQFVVFSLLQIQTQNKQAIDKSKWNESSVVDKSQNLESLSFTARDKHNTTVNNFINNTNQSMNNQYLGEQLIEPAKLAGSSSAKFGGSHFPHFREICCLLLR